MSTMRIISLTWLKSLIDIISYPLPCTGAMVWQFFQPVDTKLSCFYQPHYSEESGIKLYTHVSDRFDPFFINTISITVSEAPHVIDGLLYDQIDLDVHEHYTDTGGYSEHCLPCIIFSVFVLRRASVSLRRSISMLLIKRRLIRFCNQ